MHCLLLYDIIHDGKRQKIADACLDYGLDRLQYSAFYGRLSRNHQQELFQRTKRILGKADGRILLIPIHAQDWDTRMAVEQGMD